MEPGSLTILPTITFPNKPSKSYQCTQGPRQTQVTSCDLCVGQFLCPGVPRAHDEPKVMTRGEKKRGRWENRFRKNGSCPLQHAHTTLSRLSKDNQLRCKCSPEGGGIERSPVSFASEHKVCLWWGQLVTAERSQSVHLSQPLLHMLTEKADSCIHPGSKMIHSSHTQTHTCYTNTFGPQAGAWEVLTQSPFLLCWKAGKTVVRHGGFSAHVERLMGDYRSEAWAAAEQGPSCLTGSHLRHGPAPPAVAGSRLEEESQNWHWYNKVSELKKAPSVLRLCVNLKDADRESWRQRWRAIKTESWRVEGEDVFKID